MIKRDANYIGYMDSEFNTIKQPNDAGQLLRTFSSHTILTHLSVKSTHGILHFVPILNKNSLYLENYSQNCCSR